MTDTTTLAPTDLAKWGAPQPAAPQGDVAAWLVLADGEPHHVTPGKSDDAARLWAEEQTKCGAPYSFTFLPLSPPATQPQQAAPAHASGETETCKCCGEGSARIVVRRECDTCTSVYVGVAEHRIQKSLAEPPAQEALLNPDMPTQELRLHMGELTSDEVLVARAAIRWANSQQVAQVPLSDAEALAIVRSVPALVTAEEEWLWAIREVEKHHGIPAAQKEAP